MSAEIFSRSLTMRNNAGYAVISLFIKKRTANKHHRLRRHHQQSNEITNETIIYSSWVSSSTCGSDSSMISPCFGSKSRQASMPFYSEVYMPRPGNRRPSIKLGSQEANLLCVWLKFVGEREGLKENKGANLPVSYFDLFEQNCSVWTRMNLQGKIANNLIK